MNFILGSLGTLRPLAPLGPNPFAGFQKKDSREKIQGYSLHFLFDNYIKITRVKSILCIIIIKLDVAA